MALIVAPEEIINHRFRRGKSGKQDHLDKDAARAAELGMSYGQYKALQREGKLPANTQDDEDEEQEKLPPPPRNVPVGLIDEKTRYFQFRSTTALVEYEDGTCARVYPNEIQFADGGGFDEYDWLPMAEGGTDDGAE